MIEGGRIQIRFKNAQGLAAKDALRDNQWSRIRTD
jgi:hypothetical protein